MKKQLIQILRWAGLLLTILPAILVFTGQLSFETHKTLMLVGMLLWFVPVFFID